MSHPLASNLDQLLALYPSGDVLVERFAGRYDILFQKGKAQLLVTVLFEARAYEVGGTVPIAARSLGDVVDGAVLFDRVRSFLGALIPLEVAPAPVLP